MREQFRILLLVVFCLFGIRAAAQYEIILDGKIQSVESDSLIAVSISQKVSNTLIADGYLNYSLELKDDKYIFTSGDQYTFGALKIDDDVSNILSASGYRLQFMNDAPASKNSIRSLTDRILSYLENHGYINATLALKDTEIKDKKLHSTLVVNKGKQITNDTLYIPNKNKISRSFLERYLDIPYGKPFNAKKYKNIKQRINNLSFLKLNNDPEINLYDDRAEVMLVMEDVKASRFDFIIGVLPKTELGKTKYQIIGEFTTEMNNFFGNGESFYAHLQRLQSDNQELDLRASYPYLFNTPLIIEGNFKLYRAGNKFIETKSNIGVKYAINDHTMVGGYADYHSSRLIDIDSTSIVTRKALPEQLDVSLTGFRADIQTEKLDYKLNPTKGYRAKLSLPLFRKKIIRNRSIEDLSTSSIDLVMAYDSLQLNSIQIRPELSVEYYQPIADRFTIKVGNNSGYIFNNYEVYENEFFRLGGHQSLRGFDELSINALGYSILKTEMRMILNQGSYISLPFVDLGYLYHPDVGWEQALGVGMGINFGTSVGMFNVSFASGRRNDIPFNFNNLKVHFGYVSIF